MTNMLDYLEWRGDLTFSVAPFNLVDNEVFTQLCFMDLSGIVPEKLEDGWVSLSTAAKEYFDGRGKEITSLGAIIPYQIVHLFERAAACRRYADVLLSGYVNHIDLEKQTQFAALTFRFGSDLYIAFRGTDDTIIGWKENLNLGLSQPVPAQQEAVEYVNTVADATARENAPGIYIGGHSKGGNLALYSAVLCREEVKARIVKAYSNDGPGYTREFVNSPKYRQMQPKLLTVIPQGSVVGRLLEHDTNYLVVESDGRGLLQHDSFTWHVSGDHFVTKPALSQESVMIDLSLKKWMNGMDQAKREEFVEGVYRMMSCTGALTLTELSAERNWFVRMLRTADVASRRAVIGCLTQLTGEAGRFWVGSVLPVMRNKTSAPTIAADKKQETSEHKETQESADR